MPLNYLFADGKTHACSLILTALSMEAMEKLENLIEELFFKPNTIILDKDLGAALSPPPYFPASGKNSGCPNLAFPNWPINCWISGEVIKSMKASAPSALTLPNFSGFTSMT
jgi:hypothetical protein